MSRFKPLLFAVAVMVACLPCRPMAAEFFSGAVTPPGYPFSEAVRVGELLFLSGQIGAAPGSNRVVPGGIEAEAAQVMKNIRAVLAARDLGMGDLVKCTVMLADISEWAAFNEVYKSFFEPPYPARSAFATGGLALGARVEVECIAALSPPVE